MLPNGRPPLDELLALARTYRLPAGIPQCCRRALPCDPYLRQGARVIESGAPRPLYPVSGTCGAWIVRIAQTWIDAFDHCSRQRGWRTNANA
jgi:hypothetical protein